MPADSFRICELQALSFNKCKLSSYSGSTSGSFSCWYVLVLIIIYYLITSVHFLGCIHCHIIFSLFSNFMWTPFLTSCCVVPELYALCRYMSAGSRRMIGNSQSDEVMEDKDEKSKADGITEEEKDVKNKASSKADESELRLAQLQHQLPTNEPGALMNLVEESTADDADDDDTKECKGLFKNLKFYLSREVGYWNLSLLQAYFGVADQLISDLNIFPIFLILYVHFQVPRESLLFIIPAFGGTVSWEGEGAPFKEVDEDITHQVDSICNNYSKV